MGDTTKGIDLYKYKNRVSKLIADRVGQTGSLRQALQFQYLTFYYYDQRKQFQEKLNSFSRQEHLTDAERTALAQLQAELRDSPTDADVANVFQLAHEHEILIPKLLEYFLDDIRDYTLTAEATLMRRLRYAHVSIEEVRNLVRAGVISQRMFFRRTSNAARRQALSKDSEIPEPRLQEIYFQSIGAYKARAHTAFRWTAALVGAFFLSLFLLVQLERKGSNYDPAASGAALVAAPLSASQASIQPQPTPDPQQPTPPTGAAN
jgi:hypothetical protein